MPATTLRSAVRRRVPPAAPAASAQPVSVERKQRRHHALHPRSPGSSAPRKQVGLAEHAVQVQIEAREEVARAETEARRDDARVAVAVDDRDVRRVAVHVRRRSRTRRRAPAPARSRRALADGVDAGPSRACPTDRRASRCATSGRRPRPDRSSAARSREVCAREQSAALRRKCKQLGRERAAVDDVAVGGKRLERGDQPGLLEPVARLQQLAARRVDARRPRSSSSQARASRDRRHAPAGNRRRREQGERRLHELLPGQPAVLARRARRARQAVRGRAHDAGPTA